MDSRPWGSVTGAPMAMAVPLIWVMVSASPSGSESLERGSNVTVLSSVPVMVLSWATGASLTLSTIRCTLACTGVVPSVTVYLKSTGPLKPADGSTVTVPTALTVTLAIGAPSPLVRVTGVPTVMGLPLIWVMVNGSPSASESFAKTGIVMVVSSGVVRLSSMATGASLRPVTVRVRVVVAFKPEGSRTV